ncbi:GNAT family N-acetyltransferase [Pantoea sp. Al-1710]|uniref:GNAT family N-acetyltransferase n=1 Tax=Candidatus Pantoea communis TaxID=2608354 RepID=A0ABX0RVA3_9GAMM|nr:GNAT family N-acetyltransferase [Pantoea communis]NIG21019.1 GNAT family N-acetyltransferase [Pantoea communis]
MITIESADALAPESQRLIEQLSTELAAITGNNGKSHFNAEALNERRSIWVLAKDQQGRAVGCASLRPLSHDIAELKRMYSDRSVYGVGAALLEHLQRWAVSVGFEEIQLSTRAINTRAVDFYLKHGFKQIENYGPYVGRTESVCLSRTL